VTFLTDCMGWQDDQAGVAIERVQLSIHCRSRRVQKIFVSIINELTIWRLVATAAAKSLTSAEKNDSSLAWSAAQHIQQICSPIFGIIHRETQQYIYNTVSDPITP